MTVQPAMPGDAVVGCHNTGASVQTTSTWLQLQGTLTFRLQGKLLQADQSADVLQEAGLHWLDKSFHAEVCQGGKMGQQPVL
jgi:hypothetical protein